MFGTKELVRFLDLLHHISPYSITQEEADWHYYKLNSLYKDVEFSAGLRDYLRGDYDRVLISEIRERLIHLENGLNRPKGDYIGLELVLGCFRELIDDYTRSTLKPQSAPEPQPEPKQRYFNKAIEKGFMGKTESGYNWLFGSKASLGYFIIKIHGSNEQIPFKHLEELFGVKRLDRAVSQLADVTKPQKWRAEIDKLIEETD